MKMKSQNATATSKHHQSNKKCYNLLQKDQYVSNTSYSFLLEIWRFINLKLSEYKWQKIFNTSKMNIITMSEIQILQKKGNQLKDFKLP